MILIHIFIHGVILHNRCSPLAYERYSGSGPFSPIVPFSIYSLFPLLLLMLLSLYYGTPTPFGSPPLVEKGVVGVILIHIFIHGVILHNRCSPLAYERYSGSGPFSPIVPFSIYSLFPLLLLMLLSLYYGTPTPYIYDCSPITTHEAVAIPLPYYYT